MLKDYQKSTLGALYEFLKEAQETKNISLSYQNATKRNFGSAAEYNDAGFPNVPYVCLRLPTGGGKTLLAAHSIPLICDEYLMRDFAVVIWLVPSTAILEQTYNCLIDNTHPYRRILDEKFDGSVEVYKVLDALNISKATVKGNTCVILSTFAAWRVKSTEGRKVYAGDNGSLKPFFDDLSSYDKEHVKKLEYDESNGEKILKISLANVVYLSNPIVIIDEAHNARTPLTFDTLERLNPSCVIEFTATPKSEGKDRSNVLCSVNAVELKNEHMIKIPIELMTIPNWQQTVASAVNKRNELEEVAEKEGKQTGEYIRPITLLQAQHDSQTEDTISVEIIKKHLLDSLKINEEEIAIATGEEKGIEGIDLLRKDQKIRYIITKQALKEGWDCPFAYVFCSVAVVRSNKDAEQLLGRVLRMPKVTRKNNNELNSAYAFVYSDNFLVTFSNLQEYLRDSGFTPSESANMLKPLHEQTEFPGFRGPIVKKFKFVPKTKDIPSEFRDEIEIDEKEKTISFKQAVSPKLKDLLIEKFTETEDKQTLQDAYDITNNRLLGTDSICKKGVRFSVPQLLIDLEGEKTLFDEDVLVLPNWNLADCDPDLTEKEFPVKIQSGTKGSIDISSKGEPVLKNMEEIQYELGNMILSSKMDKASLINWLAKECRHPSIVYAQSVAFILKVVNNLLEKRKLEVDHLVYMRRLLKSAITGKINEHYKSAKKDGYQTLLFAEENRVKESLGKFSVGDDFEFPSDYPATEFYNGSYQFSKHYYGNEWISHMNEEEAECALNIDSNTNVEFWVRNLERKPNYAFWLQTSSDKFYPDFIAKLKNGIIVVVEYKGGNLYGSPDSQEKALLGDIWANASNGTCRFRMLKGKDWETLKKLLG
jgi:type III restriction enzyme